MDVGKILLTSSHKNGQLDTVSMAKIQIGNSKIKNTTVLRVVCSEGLSSFIRYKSTIYTGDLHSLLIAVQADIS